MRACAAGVGWCEGRGNRPSHIHLRDYAFSGAGPLRGGPTLLLYHPYVGLDLRGAPEMATKALTVGVPAAGTAPAGPQGATATRPPAEFVYDNGQIMLGLLRGRTAEEERRHFVAGLRCLGRAGAGAAGDWAGAPGLNFAPLRPVSNPGMPRAVSGVHRSA
jgi:hypothetical protein